MTTHSVPFSIKGAFGPVIPDTEEVAGLDAKLKAEADLRVAGDEVQVETINSSGDYVDFARDQVNEDSPAYVLFNIALTDGTTNIPYVAGGLYRFPPGSLQSKRIPLPKQAVNPVSTPEIGGGIGIVPKNIDVYTALDGDSTMSVAGLNQEFLKAKNPDQYEVWYKFEGVHTMNPPKEGNGDFTTDFTFTYNISTSEETQIGLTSTDKIVPVRLVMRKSGQFVGQLVTFLTIGDDKSGGMPVDTRTTQQIADEIDWEISPGDVYRNGIEGKYTLRYGDLSELGSAVFATVGAGLYSTDRTQLTLTGGRFEYEIDATNGRAIADNTDVGASSFPTLINLYTAQTGGSAIATVRRGVGLIRGGVSGSGLDAQQVDDRIAAEVEDWALDGNTDAIPAAKLTNALSNKERLGLMSWEVSPDAIPNNTAGAIQRDYIFSITGSDVVEGDAWIEYVIHGERFPRQAWVKSVGIQSLRLTIGAAQAGRIAAQLTERHDMVIEIQFFAQASGGSSYGSRSESVGLSVMTPGISESEAETLIEKDVSDWALEGNTDKIPASKIEESAEAGLLIAATVDDIPEAAAGNVRNLLYIQHGNSLRYNKVTPSVPKTLTRRAVTVADITSQSGRTIAASNVTHDINTVRAAPVGQIWFVTEPERLGFWSGQGNGGASPLQSLTHWQYFSSYEQAVERTTQKDSIIIYDTTMEFVTNINAYTATAYAWEPFDPLWVIHADQLIDILGWENLPDILQRPGTMTQEWQTRQMYQRVAYDATKFAAYGADRGEFMVGEGTHSKQIMFRLREEDEGMSAYVEVGLGFGGRHDSTTVSGERITAIARASGGRLILTLAENEFTNFGANDTAFLEAQSKVDRRLDQVELRPRPAARSITGNVTLDPLAFNPENVQLIGDATIDIEKTSVIGGQVFEVWVYQDGTGGRALTFNSAIVGSEPTINTGANERTILFFEYIGTAWEIVVAR